MTIRRIALGIAAAALALATAVGVYAAVQNGPGDPGPGGFAGRGRFSGPGRGGPGAPGFVGPRGALDLPLARLNLTDAQKDQVKAIMESHREEMKALADRGRAAHDALEAAIVANTVDETTIRAKSADVAAVEADVAVARARLRAEIFQVLTDAQRTQANELAANMHARRGRGK